MKILLIVNNVFYEKNGSIFTFRAIGDFAVKLLELGNDIEMLQTKLVKDEQFHDYNLNNTGIKTTALRRYKSKLYTYFIVYIVGLWRVLKNDYIYIYYPTNYHYLAFFAILFRKKYGLNVRGEQGITNKLSKFLYKHAHVVFTVSPSFTNFVIASGGNGITQRPGISFGYNDIVKTNQLNTKDFYNLLYLGRLDIEKGIIELIEAINQVKESKRYKFKLTIVGDGYHEELIYSKVAELKLDDVITFHGPENNIDKIKEIYLSSDLFILPSYHEGFPRTIYEAMIFGVPVITTFVGGISSRMIDNFNCLKIETKSQSSIVEKISYALQNYQELTTIIKNSEILIREILAPSKLTHAEEFNKVIKNEK
jgi:glycosyltransferase involved in cell wall biosynthesis